MTGRKLGDEGMPGPVADARPGPGRALPRGPGGHPPAPAVDVPPSAAGVRAEDRAQVVALWDNGWKIAEIAAHIGLYRQVVGALIGDLMRQREELKQGAEPEPAADPAPDLLSSRELLGYAGCTYRQLDEWCRQGHLVPVKPAAGAGSQRGFSQEQAETARLAVRLVNAGLIPSVAFRVVYAGWSEAEFEVVIKLLGVDSQAIPSTRPPSRLSSKALVDVPVLTREGLREIAERNAGAIRRPEEREPPPDDPRPDQRSPARWIRCPGCGRLVRTRQRDGKIGKHNLPDFIPLFGFERCSMSEQMPTTDEVAP